MNPCFNFANSSCPRCLQCYRAYFLPLKKPRVHRRGGQTQNRQTIINSRKLAHTFTMPSDENTAKVRGAAQPPPICPALGVECTNQHILTPLQALQEHASVEVMEEEIPPADRSNQQVVARRSTTAPTASPYRRSGSSCSTCSDEEDYWGTPTEPRTKEQIEEDERA